MQPGPAAVVAALLVVVGLAQAEIDLDEAKVRFDKCVNLTGAEESFDDIVKKQVMPTSEKGICLVECLMKENKFLDDEGKYDLKGVLAYIKQVLEGRPSADENYQKAEKIAKDCGETDIEGLDKCEAAVKYTTCLKVKADKEKIYVIEEKGTSS